MLGVVARPSIEGDWQHSLGAYDFQEQAVAERRLNPMATNRSRDSRLRVPNVAVQNQSFRTLEGQTNSPIALQLQSDLAYGAATYTTAPSSFASLTSENFCPRQQPSSHTRQVINANNPVQYPAAEWSAAGIAGPSPFQYQQSAGPRRSSRLPPNNASHAIQLDNNSYSLAYNHQAALTQADNLTIPQHTSNQQFLTPNYPNMAATFDAVNVNPLSPVSHSGPHSRTVTPLPEAARKRRYSQVSTDPMVDQTTTDGYDDAVGPRKSRTIKRDDAPMNDQHKYFCNVSDDCVGIVFERKCEWGKHMDKHDRPYRCQHAQCAKLQGFTYSGGLLRHEREVHNKHGGPKAFLFCPHVTCKRHTEKGFTRKENLQEHIRRVHSESHDPAIAPGLDQMEPVSAMSQATADELYAAAALSDSNKRERSYDEAASDNVHELREEVKSLRAQVRRLEEDARQKDAQYAALEAQMQMQMQQSGR